jgi:rubrerythrin
VDLMTKKDEIFKQQIELENEIIAAAEKSVSGIKNLLVKEIILSIALDSKKHANMLSALLAIQSTTQPFISEKISKEIEENILKHIKLEQKAIETYKDLLEKIENEQEKMIIQALYHDELRHHALLKKIYSTIIERETLDEGEVWEFIKDDFIPQF